MLMFFCTCIIFPLRVSLYVSILLHRYIVTLLRYVSIELKESSRLRFTVLLQVA